MTAFLAYAAELLGATLRLATPLIFAALGGLLSERSGVINIALEGKMLIGAFVAGVCAAATGSPWLGFLAGGLAGMAMALVYATAVLGLGADQIVAGTGINMLAAGAAPFLGKILYDVTGSTPALTMASRFHLAPLPIALVLSALLAGWMRWSAGGLRLMVAGEHPAALAAAGVSVKKLRLAAVLAAGFLAGLGGSSLAIYLASGYSRNMTAGRGFIALAALILGKWRPLPAVFACLLFGLCDAVQIRLQGVALMGFGKVPVQFIQMLPYLVTIIVLAGFVGKAEAPKALGLAFKDHE